MVGERPAGAGRPGLARLCALATGAGVRGGPWNPLVRCMHARLAAGRQAGGAGCRPGKALCTRLGCPPGLTCVMPERAGRLRAGWVQRGRRPGRSCRGRAARAARAGRRRDQPGFPGPDDRAGELPGAGELVGFGAAQPQRPPGGDQVGDCRQAGDLGEGQGPGHHGRLSPGAAGRAVWPGRRGWHRGGRGSRGQRRSHTGRSATYARFGTPPVVAFSRTIGSGMGRAQRPATAGSASASASVSSRNISPRR